MIDYAPFWRTIKARGENWYSLKHKYNLSDSTLHRLKHNKHITTRTLNDLCRILDCKIEEIAVYTPSEKGNITAGRSPPSENTRQIRVMSFPLPF